MIEGDRLLNVNTALANQVKVEIEKKFNHLVMLKCHQNNQKSAEFLLLHFDIYLFQLEIMELQILHHSMPPHAKGFFPIDNRTCLKVN